jgi:hypothetical protein
MNLPCPECGEAMEGGYKKQAYYFRCARGVPVAHTVTIFWKRPQDAPLTRGGDGPVVDADAAPPPAQVSSRLSSLLSRAEKLTQGRVGK